MHDLYKLKSMLCEELEDYGKQGELNTGSLEVVDKLAHAAKNVCRVIEYCEDDEYSAARDGMHSRNGYAYTGMSYDRGRNNAPRDSRGRYSGDDGLSRELRALMPMARDEQTRMEMQRLADRVERG